MFERLVVSTVQRRKHTTAKFFLGTVVFYAFVFGCAFVVSVLVSDPKLADTHSIVKIADPPRIHGDFGPKSPPTRRPMTTEVRPDPNHVMDLETLMSKRSAVPPIIEIPRGPSDPFGRGISGGPPEIGGGIGTPQGANTAEPAPMPEQPKPKPVAQIAAGDSKPLRVTSSVLQGKAIERAKPNYPTLARQVRLQGDVSVEVIISPEGRVESARVISGHPMFAQCSIDAARLWRFEPTLLNKVPVRVTGVITFVFKMNE
jgi:protein TonB